MSSESSPPISFSAARRWGIFFSVVISIITVFVLVVMLNYLGARYYKRFVWSRQTDIQLSPQTIALLKSITNQVSVVAYYDKSDKLYGYVKALLEEYHLTNPKISVQTVDYLVDATLAQQVKATNRLGSGDDKNLVIFNCNLNGIVHRKIINAALLADNTYEQVENEKEIEYKRTLKAFEGEKWFSAALLSITNPKPFTACFLEGDGEHVLDDNSNNGYSKFGQVLEENNIQSLAINLHGSNAIPADCNLLIIAGPQHPVPVDELSKIKQYLVQGGRLFVLFNFNTRHGNTGLEAILTDWNVDVGMNFLSDPKNTMAGGAVAISRFSRNHPVVEPLLGFTIAMVNPRSIAILNLRKEGPDAPKVEELAWTGENAMVGENPVPVGHEVPVMVAVEKGGIKGVVTERGTTAILVVGDSLFLSNMGIDFAENRDFAGFAVNWLLDQTQLLQGVGPHPVKEYKLMMTKSQMTSVRWIFLAAMPGGILAFGGLVWFRRRH